MLLESAFQAVAILAFFAIAASIHGMVLAFRASIILGLVCFFLAIPFAIIAIVYWFSGVDLAEKIVKALPEVFVL